MFYIEVNTKKMYMLLKQGVSKSLVVPKRIKDKDVSMF